MTTPSQVEQNRAALDVLQRRLDPHDPLAANNLGVVFFQHGFVDEAARSFARAHARLPTAPVIHANLERASRASTRADRQVAGLRDRLRGDPADGAARFELAAAYVALGQYETAREELGELVARDAGHVDGLVALARCERQMGDVDAASEWLARARSVAPERADVLLDLGQACYLQGRSEAAVEVLQAAAAAHPTHAAVHYQLGTALGDLGRHAEAREATRRALELDPALGSTDQLLALESFEHVPGPATSVPGGVEDSLTETVAQHVSLAASFRNQGLLADALREYRLALDAGEDRHAALHGMAEVLLLRREPDSALEIYETLSGELRSAAVANERAVALHHVGRLDEAMEGFRRALALDDGYVLARNNLAITLAQAGRPDEAAGEFAEAVRGDPRLLNPRVNLGLLLHATGRYRHALQAFRQVVELAPETAVAWNGIGLVLVSTYRVADARNAFVRAIEADSRCAEAHYNLSFALSQLGEFDAALRAVTRAQTLDPYFVPQKFRFLIAAQLAAGDNVLPEMSADVSADVGVPGLVLDVSQFDELFETLEAAHGGGARPGRDSLTLAWDYRARGMLDLAAAEAGRALGRGANAVEAAVLLGTIHADRGLHGEALERFREARAIEPDHREAQRGEVRALLALARADEALEDAKVLAEDGEDVDAMTLWARAELGAGDSIAALDVVQRARARDPQRADLLRLEGEIAMVLGKPHMAREAFAQSLEIEPHDAEGWTVLGRAMEALEEPAPALEAYEHALREDPACEDAALAVGRLRAARGDGSGAVNRLVDFLLVDPASVRGLRALAAALFDQRRVEQADEAVERVLARDPDDPDGLWLKARILVRRRQFDAAVACWERVIATDPGSDRARRARRHIRTAGDLRRILATEAA